MMTDCKTVPGPGFWLGDYTPTALDTSDLPPRNPITIMSGDVTFDADPADGTISVETSGNGYTVFTVEEFGLIAALLVNTADGDY